MGLPVRRLAEWLNPGQNYALRVNSSLKNGCGVVSIQEQPQLRMERVPLGNPENATAGSSLR
jgi:hypothetical protein